MNGHHIRYEELFRKHFSDVLAYSLRRNESHQDAEDVTAETFAVAWRRIRELPPDPEARLWLFGTARLVTMNHRRGRRRQLRLVDRLRGPGPRTIPSDWDAQFADRDELSAALTAVGPADREVLMLHAWEQLSSEEIAITLEISPVAARKRLQRARERMAAALDDLEEPPDDRRLATAEATRREATS